MNIADLIKQSGKTREQICQEAQISRGFLSLLESGDRKVGHAKVKDLARALGVAPAVLRPDWVAAFSDAPLSEAS